MQEIKMKGHKIILNDFLNLLKKENISNILDAGSGRTSLSIIANLFPNTHIDAVVYPGDIRKINSIKERRCEKWPISRLRQRKSKKIGFCSGWLCRSYSWSWFFIIYQLQAGLMPSWITSWGKCPGRASLWGWRISG